MIANHRSLAAVVFLVTLVAVGNGACLAAGAAPAVTRRAIAAALNSAFPGAAAGRRAQAKHFLSLYTAAGELPAAEQARLKVRLRSRLARLASVIQQDVLEARRAQAAQSASTAKTPSVGDTQLNTAGRAGGAAVQDEGQSLVDLIQATIAPETWDVNGGPGVIRYWPAWHALVVRQTDEVHEQIGGIVHGVRK